MGCYMHLPLEHNIVLGVITYVSFFHYILLEQVWIYLWHITFQLPSIFFWTKVLPLHLDLFDGTVPE